jgi:hypothetical protein
MSHDYWWSNLTLRRLHEMNLHLEQHPPAEFFLAGYFKYEPPDRARRKSQSLKLPEPLPRYEP